MALRLPHAFANTRLGSVPAMTQPSDPRRTLESKTEAELAAPVMAPPEDNHDASDLELVQRAQRGERGAFDLLVLKYQHKVVKLIGRFISNPTEAEDVSQDAFVKAYRALNSFRGDSAFYTWIYRIAINTAKNALVANKRRPIAYNLDLQDPEQYEHQARLKDTATPERLLLTDEIRRTVQQAMRDLPVDLRTAVMLREIDGLSYEEIAETMECPVGTVRSRIFRAREAIDNKLKPLLD